VHVWDRPPAGAWRARPLAASVVAMTSARRVSAPRAASAGPGRSAGLGPGPAGGGGARCAAGCDSGKMPAHWHDELRASISDSRPFFAPAAPSLGWRRLLAGELVPSLTLRRLRAAALVLAAAFVGALEAVRRAMGAEMFSWPGALAIDAAIFAAAAACILFVFRGVARMQARLERQNRELEALHQAALDIYGELALEPVLQKIVDQACGLVGTRYGALSVVGDHGRIESFVTSGVSAEERAHIGALPQGRGLLGVALHEGQRLRLADMRQDPRAVGFPPNHPPMRSLLAVPVTAAGPFHGNLYLSEKADGSPFTAEEEEVLVRFALKAAIAIDHAHLHRRLKSLAVAEERLRIAHEMHDGLAQVLAYVNTKAQAIGEFLGSGRTDEARRQLDELAHAAREVYGDVRESIIGLRAAAVVERPVTEALAEYTAAWQDQSGIRCRLRVGEDPRLPAGMELQLLRIVQESLTNVRKHAHANVAEVALERVGDRVTVVVQDDGIGFDPADLGRSEFPRFGLATMRERAESMGGTVQLESTSGAGTRVVVEVPVPPAALGGP